MMGGAQYGVAVDIGTTTLDASLCAGGAVVAEASAKNPQTIFGADVISRVGGSLGGSADELAKAVRDGINELIASLCTQRGIAPREIGSAVLTGNTAMLYLLTGRSPKSLAAAPFAADWLAGEYTTAEALGLTLADGAQVLITHCMSAFVGGDITTALLASGITGQRQTALLVDIGTNGEMALWHNGNLTCCSTAAGPAFEGASITCGMRGVPGAIDHVYPADNDISYTVIGGEAPLGLCGSAIVDAVAAMLALGAVDETGRIDPDGCVCPERITESGNDLLFTIAGKVGVYGKDIRAVQLAKSAIRAGLETLLSLSGVEMSQVCHLYIAGGFGSFLDLDSAAAIGLIPPALRPVARAIGNAALAGAVMLLNDSGLIPVAQKIAASAAATDLGTSHVFMDSYMDNMGF